MKTRSTFAEKFRQPIFRNLLFAFGITLLGVFSLFSYYRIRAMVGSSNMVNHTNLVILKIEQALSIVKDAETGQRGFIITNDSVFFQPAIGADDHAMKVLAELKLLITDDETQTENLHRYKALILSRINHLKISREYRNTPGYDPNILKSHLLEGKRSMDSVRSQAAMMEQVEQKLLSQRIGRNEQNIIFTPIFSLIVSALLLTIIIISFYKLRHRY